MKASCLRSPLLMGCLLLSLAGQGVCEERRVLRSDITHNPPSAIIDKGTYSGIDVEILRLIANHFNWRIEFFECPSKRCDIMLSQGELDITSDLMTEEKKYLHFIEPPLYVSSARVFYFRKGAGLKIEKYEDLKNLTIGMIIRVKYFEPFASDATLVKFPLPFELQLFKMLESGRIDTFVGHEITSDESLKEGGFENKFEKALYRVDPKEKGGIVISKKSPYAKDRFKIGAFIQQLFDSGKIKEIEAKYGYSSTVQQAPK